MNFLRHSAHKAGRFCCREANRLTLNSCRRRNPAAGPVALVQVRLKSGKSNDPGNDNISSLVQPIPVKPINDLDGINVGEELTGRLQKGELKKILNQFFRQQEIKRIAAENGLDSKLFHQAFVGFRRFCLESGSLPTDLHISLSDILQGAGHIDDLLPYFLDHAKKMFPHLDCMDDLKKISDLRSPPLWYQDARNIQRKIIFHAGPTNSGKTYHALERFFSAKSGVYCGPLRLLANEVFSKSNDAGTVCDLVTGEERRHLGEDGEPSAHVACTVEMTSVNVPYEVAVIDEIQMLRDKQRGWAWTRAFLGLCAEEIHVCGEESAIPLVRELAMATGDEFQVHKYKRLTPLTVLDSAIGNFSNVKAGDCIVCFGKQHIYHVSRELEKRGHEVAVIYGTLPAGTKLAQAAKFNDPENPCKIMVSTDAIGMGLNLNIKRVIFYSLMKPTINEKGEKEIEVIPPSVALQIAGRAGRYKTQFSDGEVTTFRNSDLPELKKLLNMKIEPISRAGLQPTAEQIELFAYHLPKATLSNLIDIFVTLSQLDSDKYFMCNVDDFKFLADMIEHVPLALRSRYVFCCAPISRKQPFVCTMFLKFARRFSREEPLTIDWLCRQLDWPFKPPKLITDLVHLEAAFDILDLYLWLSYRFSDMFPDTDHVRDMQRELDSIIQAGVYNIVKLLKNTETDISSGNADTEDDFEMKTRSGSDSMAKNIDSDFDDYVQGDTRARSSLTKRFLTAKNIGNRGGVSLKGGQKISNQLLSKGLLSEEMLKKLQEEILRDAKKRDDD